MERLIEHASVELVMVGIIIAALVMGWAFTSGLVDDYGPFLCIGFALTVGTILPSLYIIYGIGGL
ncbi:hypothetical protein [Amylibacter sp. IMCC11727]|uniref:hypothetical protein n=1 Tax=Amylibacter sp. IMCC11727 TaxID=3039851 RepID=UPI00244DFB8C|nr:hypothetical protein [Amylibacter sp. IMCC11727]WGI20909.1 hypothetical protein QBD29_12410 [Amylibacter sp. IMCC11727]